MAGRLLLKRKGVREVGRLVGASPGAVSRWKRMVEQGDLEALKVKPHPGRPLRLTSEQKEELAAILLRGARAAGFPTDLWTLSRVAEGIEREFGVRYHPGHVWRILRGMGWSCQKPARRARERDEKAIREWREKRWAQVKKALENGWYIIFIGESGFMLQPVVRRMWVPRGETPIQDVFVKRKRTQVVAPISSDDLIPHSDGRLGL